MKRSQKKSTKDPSTNNIFQSTFQFPQEILHYIFSYLETLQLIKILSLSKETNLNLSTTFWESIFQPRLQTKNEKTSEIEDSEWSENSDNSESRTETKKIKENQKQQTIEKKKSFDAFEFRREVFKKNFVKYKSREDVLEKHAKEWDKVPLHFAISSSSQCLACGYLITERSLVRCFRMKGKQSPRSVHVSCDVLLYGTKGRKYYYYGYSDSSVDEELSEIIDDFCTWVVTGKDVNNIPEKVGIKSTKKLVGYKDTYLNDFFKR